MKSYRIWFVLSIVTAACTARAQAEFTRLEPVPPPKIAASTTHYPGNHYIPSHLVDRKLDTEYAADGQSANAFVEFDLGKTVTVGAFTHVDREDPATVAASELIFTDEEGKTIATVPVKHVNQAGGTTRFALPSPVAARRIRWRVTELGPDRHKTVGGREITFYAVAGTDAAPSALKMETSVVPILRRAGGGSVRPVRMYINYPYAEPLEVTVGAEGSQREKTTLQLGSQVVETAIPTAEREQSVAITIEAAGKVIARGDVQVKPLHKSVIYLLPHSHVDIGYTALQTDVVKKQIDNIEKGIDIAQATADYPEGARYRWNVEVLWSVENYLNQSPEKKAKFIDAVKKGWIGLDGMYGNELTGLCRPEELLRLFSYAHQLENLCGVTIDSAMISDVPGYTWGTLTAMQQSGIKYWSIGPNYFDRMGFTIATWENKPFWWVSPDGKHKVLCWIPYQGYAMSHIVRSTPTPTFVAELMTKLEANQYPYDLIYIRWSGYTDNAEPDGKIPDFVKSWNEQYESPHFVISTTHEAFSAMEKQYGDKLPTFKGDWTPYWEDGAGSSAAETATNRNAADRLTQAETLFAMLNPAKFPASEFYQAWRNVVLYSEHTWGAHNSVTEPEVQFVKDQWKIKQAFALDAGRESAELIQKALPSNAKSPVAAVDVFNTTSWPRTDLAIVSKAMSKAGDRVTDSRGEPAPSQRLSTGELAFMAADVPGFGCRRYAISSGTALSSGGAAPNEIWLENEKISLGLDPTSGGILHLESKGIDADLVDAKAFPLNDFFFMSGADAKKPQHAQTRISFTKEHGPLVASLVVESDAPGCNKLTREIRLIAGQDYVEIINTIDKKRIEVHPKPGDWNYAGKQSKEGLHFGYAFNVPDGVMRMDIPWAMMQPEVDQIPGACKNWFSVGRWVDISNETRGVTWVTLDSPLVEVGALTANLLGSQNNPKVWIDKLEPTQKLYSWVMNNHWHTNYRAYQEGEVTFRYAIRPHKGFDPAEATRFAVGLSQPLVVAPASENAPTQPRLKLDSPDVVITAFKPSDDGKATIVRLFGAAGRDAQVTLQWADPKPASVSLSNASEKPLSPIDGPIGVPAWGVVTIRAELP